MKHINFPSFHEVKGRSSARKRKILAIRGTLGTSEEGSLGIDYMILKDIENDIESKFCQPKYRIEFDYPLTEKYEFIKTRNTLREQTNQLISHVETLTANLQNVKNNIKLIKTKTIEMYPGIRKMFKSATGLDSNDFLAVFKFLNTGPHCENTKFYDSQAKRELKTYTQNVKPGMKAKLSGTDHFFL